MLLVQIILICNSFYVTCAVVDREGNSSTYKSVKANGNTIFESYDLGSGNVRNIKRDFDGFNNKVAETIYEGPASDYSDGKGNKTSYIYDGNNNQQSKTNPLGQVESFTYNAQNLITSYTDELGNTTNYSYANNLVTAIENPLGQSSVIVYESGAIKGLVKSYQDFNGNTTTFEYNSNGDLKSAHNPLGTIQEITAYDAIGRKLNEENQQADKTVMRSLAYTYWDSSQLKTFKEWLT
mgnify:FL=1